MLGTMGLGLIGRHLQKKAKETEQQIRLRAYGSQALQWWDVLVETAFVMAYESGPVSNSLPWPAPCEVTFSAMISLI